MPFTVGLTGGIGSGKSAAAQVFEELGTTVIDTDAVAHALTAPGGAAIEPIRAAFGAAYLTPEGALERARMRELVFADALKKRLLESILHPLIRARTSELVQAARSPYVVLMVPLLVESGDYRRRCQRILVVDCPEELQVERVMARSGLAAGQVRAIMANQVTREARLAAADDVVDNSQDLAQLRRQVEALHARYLQLAAAGG
ncbi:MAG: dephospho-CoA kinase [Betaproteobacteria bacterium]|nr:MAG: dephospho-CoA kinase [Betaproteobacteria bacterium]